MFLKEANDTTVCSKTRKPWTS